MVYSLRNVQNQATCNAIAEILGTDDDGNLLTEHQKDLEEARGHSRGSNPALHPGRGTGRGRGHGRGNHALDGAQNSADGQSERGRGRGHGRGRGWGRGRGRGRGQGPRRVTTDNSVVPMEELTEMQIRQTRERQREARLLQNQREQQAQDDEINLFFAEPSRPTSPTFPPSPFNMPDSPINQTPQASFRRPEPRITPRVTPRTVHFHRHTPGASVFRRSVLSSNRRRPPQRKQMQTGHSKIWSFFRTETTGEKTIAICKLCLPEDAYPYAKNTGTSTLRRHVIKEHPCQYVEFCKKMGLKIPETLLNSNGGGTVSRAAIKVTPFSEQAFKATLVNFVIVTDSAIRIVDTPEFRNLLYLLRPQIHIPHRTAMRNMIVNTWKHYFGAECREIQNAEGRVSLTMDIWDDKSFRSYIGVTAHYLAYPKLNSGQKGSLTLKSALISFLPIPGKHRGQDIARSLLFVTNHAGITNKIQFITTDGASNMAAALHDYEVLLHQQYPPVEFDSLKNHLVCLPHRLHIAVSAMINACTGICSEEIALNPDLCISEPNAEVRSHLEALAQDPMAKLQFIGNDVRVSQLKRHKFKRIVASINQKRALEAETYHFHQRHLSGDGQSSSLPSNLQPLKDLILFRQVVNRWGSALAMLQRGLYLREAVDRYIEFTLAMKYRISALEWKVLEDIYTVLEPLHAVQTLMCSEATPTMSFYFPFYHGLISALERQCDDPKYSYLRGVFQAAITKLEEHMHEMRFSKAILLSIVLHPALRYKWIKDNWPAHRLVEAQETILKELRKYDQAVQDEVNTTQPSVSRDNGGFNVFSLLSDADSAPVVTDVRVPVGLDAEWSAYCYATSLPDKRVDLIQWWQEHEHQFPRLFRLALDYLPAQASSVPAERIFSAGGETDRRRRNRISPGLFEQLQMLKFMMKKARLDFGERFRVSDEDLESDNQFLDCGLSGSKSNEEFVNLLNIVSATETDIAEDVSEPEEDGEYFDLDNVEDNEDEHYDF